MLYGATSETFKCGILSGVIENISFHRGSSVVPILLTSGFQYLSGLGLSCSSKQICTIELNIYLICPQIYLQCMDGF